jgi:hypothetical protein
MPPISIHHGVLSAIMTKDVFGMGAYRRECRVLRHAANKQFLRIDDQQ